MNAINNFKKIALVLQGGGAIGSYHMGVYKALSEEGLEPNIFCGVSIGAITAAILAGNKKENRLNKLEEFWQRISWPELHNKEIYDPNFKTLNGYLGTLASMSMGQPHFFMPRLMPHFLAPKGSPDATSLYDTTPLRNTLLDLIDPKELANNQLIVGATHVKTGDVVFFDSSKEELTIDHIMASCAIPPQFSGVKIDGELFWDGGVVVNNPIEGITDILENEEALVLVVDLFTPTRSEPHDISDINVLMNQLVLASKTKNYLKYNKEIYNLKGSLHALLEKLPPEMLNDPLVAELNKLGKPKKHHIVHLGYRTPFNDMANDFSSVSVGMRIERGYEDMKRILKDQNAWSKQELDTCSIHSYSTLERS